MKRPAKRDPPDNNVSIVPAGYQRTPTLISHGEPGDHGTVKVWAPSRCILWFLAAFLCFIGAALTWTGGLTRHESCLLAAFYIISSIVPLWICQRALRRPVYLTTDDNAVALTSEKGTAALQWSDIAAVECSDKGHAIVKEAVKRPEPIIGRLTGYWLFGRMDILDCITIRAGLTRSPENRNRSPVSHF